MDSELSNEMMMEIISRVSLNTLGIIRCMSKELNALTYESYFLDLYKKRNKTVSGYLMQNMKRGWMYMKEFAPSPESRNLDLGFLPFNARILATSEQGIIVFQHQDPMNHMKDLYHVCKPATKQVLQLPKPKGKCVVRQVAIVVMGLKPLRYKIIKLSDHRYSKRWRKFYTSYRCDIFDSVTWKWRSLSHVLLSDFVYLTNSQPITKGDSVYMLLTNNDILRFDAYSEKWKVFSSPIPYDESGFSRPLTELVKYDGRLGLACRPLDSCCWEIWVHSIDNLWEKEADDAGGEECKKGSLKALYDSDTSVMVDRHTLMFCRFKQQDSNNMISKVVLKDIGHQIFSFRSDFEPVEL